MAEGLFDGGQKHEQTVGASFDDAIYNLLYQSDLDFLAPRERAVPELILPSDDSFVVRSRSLMFDIEQRQPPVFDYAEPRWRDDVRDRDDEDPKPPRPNASLRDLQKHALDAEHDERFADGGDDLMDRLQRAAQPKPLLYDPNNPASILRAGGSLLGPLARSVSERLVNGPSSSCPVRPLPVPSLLQPASKGQALRLASGLPDGPLVPDTIKEITGRALDGVTSRKAHIATAAAVVVAGSILAQTMGTSSKPTSAETFIAGKRPSAATSPAPVIDAPPSTPKAVEVVEVSFSYTTTEPASIKAVANAMQASSAEILRTKPGLSLNGELPVGSQVGGTVRGSRITLPAPVNVDQLAQSYGLPSDAIRSVNTVNAHGLVDGEVIIPGRQIILIPPDQPADLEVIAETFGLSEIGKRETARVNQQAPDGELVLPLSAPVEEQLDRIEEAVVVATAPSPTPPADHPVETVPVSTTIVTPQPEVAPTPPAAPQAEAAPSTTSTVPLAEVAPVPAESQPVVPEPAPQISAERPATPEEKLNKDIEAVHQALEHALASGDLGPLNHLVAHSPIFKGYNLTAEQQSAGMRHLPPANFFGDWLKYEFGQNTPDNERMGNTQLLSTLLYYAYSLQKEVQSNPVWAAAFPEACARFNDLTAFEGHQSHKAGKNADVNSAFICNVVVGRAAADGPTGWVNRSASISNTIANPNYNYDLDFRLVDRLRQAHIDGAPVLKSMLYNAPDMPPVAQEHENHGDHMHISVDGAHDASLANVAHGGGRPEQNLDAFRAQVLLTYVAGEGVPGISLNWMITEFISQPPGLEQMNGIIAQAVAVEPVPADIPAEPTVTPLVAPAELDPAAQLLELAANPTEGMKHAFVRTLLMNEIAKGEGGYDSSNRGHAGDMQVGDANYRKIFGDKPLSQHTLAELMELQRKDRIFTIGRYQLIPGTTRGAVEATGFDVNRVFDAAAQDELAVNYLIFMKRPNLSAFIKGDESKLYKAVEDLCMEFASMPCNDGSGYYDGDSAGNNAMGGKLRVAWIREILNHLRITYAAAQAEINTAAQAA